MTRRPLLWIAAAGVAVGVWPTMPLAAGADAAEDGWRVTIDQPTGEWAARHVVIKGAATNDTASEQPVTVTVGVIPEGLPTACGPQQETTEAIDGRYTVSVEVACNGPHRIEALARAGPGTSTAVTRQVSVAERPPEPLPPHLEETSDGGLAVTWAPSNDLDAAGWVLLIGRRELTVGPETHQLSLPPEDRRAAVYLRALRWGSGGPGTTVASNYSMGNILANNRPSGPVPPDEPALPPDELALPPDEPRPGDLALSPAPPLAPMPSTTAPPELDPPGSDTIPAHPGADDSTKSKLEPDPPRDDESPAASHRRPASTEARAASASSPARGLVSTSDQRSPTLVTPLALAVMAITIAIHLAWYRRRHMHRDQRAPDDPTTWSL